MKITLLYIQNIMKTNLRRKPHFSQMRADKTVQFLEKTMPDVDVVLDIGEPNPTGRYLCEHFNVKPHNTLTDLDYSIGPNLHNSYEVVWCFEVIEHLMNPRMLLDNIYSITTKGAKLYLSYPSRPKWLWNNKDHFHEYDKRRRDLLFEKTGWRITDSENIYKLHKKIGIRPIVRNFIPVTTIYLLEKE